MSFAGQLQGDNKHAHLQIVIFIMNAWNDQKED